MPGFTDDGFFRTGDRVEICGHRVTTRIVGPLQDIINRGGMKISPAELDVALEQHPQVTEAAVCAFPDERTGRKSLRLHWWRGPIPPADAGIPAGLPAGGRIRPLQTARKN